jgi:YfiH family protein
VSHVLRSRLLSELGFRHGFNLRTGGASEGPFASFNLGRAVGDEPGSVEENHRRFALAVGYAAGTLYETSQVHGNRLYPVAAGDDPVALRKEEADALLAVREGQAIGIRVADCVPILIADACSRSVAAVHAGWRGAVRGVVESAVDALLATSAEPAGLVAAIFPHIGRCCFEVGSDVADELVAVSPDREIVELRNARPYVDLAALVIAKLQAAGVPQARIERVAGCTRCDPERFFSFRREGQRSGRHLAAIVAG